MNYAQLINKNNKIKPNFFKYVTLVSTKDSLGEDILVEDKTFIAYSRLKDFLETKDIHICIDSAYRSFDEQKEIYDEFMEKYGREYTDRVVAPIGSSEHHSGLAIDISLIVDGKILKTNEELLEHNSLFKEIHKYLSNFGFILRYPEGKEGLTGYDYEPWHIRYVGDFIAKIIYRNNYTLEEYLTSFGGVLVVDKPKGITSFDVVDELSHLFGIKKIGHTGTLDPLAEGVLVVAIGQATKAVELLTASCKEYIAGVLLGVNTNTLDITGTILDKRDVPLDIDIENGLNSYQKTYLQEVPIYSAVKVNGKKLYQYARNNENVVLPKKEVTIEKIELLSKRDNTFTFKCLVSKGCYIRSLIRDIALSMGTYATMTSLTRTRQGHFTLEEAYSLDDIRNNHYKIYKVEDALDYKKIKVSREVEKKIRVGQRIYDDFGIEDKVIFISQDGILLGIYERCDNYLIVWKNFV